MKVKEIIYMVLDELHQYSDDSNITEEHIIFLAGRYRSFLLKQRYLSDLKKEIPESNYQTLCLQLEKKEAIDGLPCEGGYYIRTTEKIPTTLPIGNVRLTTTGNYYSSEITYVSRDRMKYVGNNSWMKNIIYASLDPSGRIYMTSQNPQFLYLDGGELQVTGIFEDAEEASEYECDNKEEGKCDIMERKFPIEDALVAPLIELIVKELSPSVTAPEDEVNDASDNLTQKARG